MTAPYAPYPSVLLALLLAASAIPGVAAVRDCPLGGCPRTSGLGDSQNFLQTYHQVQAQAVLSHDARWANASGARAWPERRSAKLDNLCIQPFPLQLQLGIESIRALGYAPSRAACGPVAAESNRGGELVLSQLGLSQGKGRMKLWGYAGVVPLVVLAGHLLVSFLGAFLVFRSVLWSPPKHVGPASEDPEVLAWRRGCWRWLLMDWVSGWVSRWGTSTSKGPTKIRADEVTVLANPEDACEPCFRRFEYLWRQEIEREGLERASLLKVVIRFVTYRKVFAIVAWNALYEGCLFLGPPLAIEWIVSYANWLYVQRMEGTVISQAMLVRPSLFTIALFTGLPAIVAISNTVSNMINARIGVCVTGALASAVMRKGQLLPVVSNSEASGCNLGPDADRPNGEEGSQARQDRGLEAPQRYSLVQLVTSDVAASIMAIPLALARVVVMVPVMLVMFGLLCRKLRWAFIFCVALTFPMVFCVVAIGVVQKRYLLSFMNLAGRRLQFFQQIIFGIRVVKSFGGEGLCQGRLELFRKKELQALNGYYSLMCFMFQAQWQFPRLYLAASLGGYILVHGDIPVTSIIAIIPLLSSFQSCVGSVIGLIPTLVSARPSCMRLTTFLKLPEAPCFLPLDQGSSVAAPKPASGAASSRQGMEAVASPGWITTSPATKGVEEAGILRVDGSFSWRESGTPVVRDLDILVPRGQLVAVLGPPGAGKTALLHAILGELHPLGESRIQVPGKIAYSAQVPHIIEGTLKENILFMEPFDEDRYATAIHASGLLPDLEVLPGSEEVPVGSRGITLSGGQRARLSLARAAYSKDTDVILLDDVFGSLDSRTANHVSEHLLQGPAARGRTRIVVCQPNAERLATFDRVLVIWGGRVEADGSPDEVMQTNAYKKLLGAGQGADARNPGAEPQGGPLAPGAAGRDPLLPGAPASASSAGREVLPIWEEEPQGRASWETVGNFVRMGGRLNIAIFLVLFLMKNLFDMAMNMVLASWMTDGSLASFKATKLGFQRDLGDGEDDPNRQSTKTYLLKFCFWWTLSIAAWFACWAGGHLFTLNISKGCHTAMVTALMRAPIDKFFDRTPVGRIMNRASNDMMNVDLQVFMRICAIMGMVWSVVVPLVYVHMVMPAWFTVASLPCYYILFCLLRLYWKTMVPLRYLAEVCKSAVNAKLAEVETNNPSVRAYRKSNEQLAEFQLAMKDLIGARFASGTALRCWLAGRLLVLGGFFVTSLALLIIWVPGVLDVGRASLCLMGVFSILSGVEGSIEVGASAQYQLIAMNRIHEYTRLPEEREEELITDKTLADLVVSLPRSALGSLVCREGPNGVEVLRGGSGHVILRQVPQRPALLAVPGCALADLAPDSSELRLADSWHRVIAANGACATAEEIAEEMCGGSSAHLTLRIRSGWLADGAAVKIHQLRAAYAGSPGDVLQGVDLSIPRRCRAAIVGAASSGKSTLLLCIIRMLEPISGRILLEGVNTQRVGLRTLRSAVGLVPQDPVLLEGSLRSNVDPFAQHSDASIWEALRIVQLEEFVVACEGGLNFMVTEEGSNVSFGHRQLLCLARLVLRQPNLLLLDDAFSALDLHTQEAARCRVRQTFPDSTILAVEHRLQTVMDFDLVAVMDKGRVVEQGDPKALVEVEGGHFSRMMAVEKGYVTSSCCPADLTPRSSNSQR